jgi:hypothetical protein
LAFTSLRRAGRRSSSGVYTFKTLTVDANVVINAYGVNGIALVSAGDLTMNGQFDATCAGNVNLAKLFGQNLPYLSGPGGAAGGQPGTTNQDGVGAAPGGGGAGADNTHQGGGCGGAGRVRIESRSGSATIDGVQSPVAAQGTVDVTEPSTRAAAVATLVAHGLRPFDFSAGRRDQGTRRRQVT